MRESSIERVGAVGGVWHQLEMRQKEKASASVRERERERENQAKQQTPPLPPFGVEKSSKLKNSVLPF